MINQPMMTCEDVDEALLDYLEETLEAPSRMRVDEHVAGCGRCAAIVDDIAGIRSEAAQLPELVPSGDLWERISARIEPAVLPMDARRTRAVPRHWMPAAAAAAALVVATAGITYFATSRSLAGSAPRVAVAPAVAPILPSAAEPESVATEPSGVQPTPVESPTAEPSSPSAQESRRAAEPRGVIPGRSRTATLASRSSVAAVSPAESAYGDEIQRLQRVVTQRRRELDPATVAVIEQSLKIIDMAVKQSRAALARDPGSGFLADQLTSALDRKVELLRTVALLPSRT